MKVITYSILIVILIAIGFFLNKDFFNASFSLIDTKDIILENRILSGDSSSSLLFPIVLGILPLLYLLVWKATKIAFLYKGIIACGIILVFGFLIWRLRVFGLNSEFMQLSSYNLPDGLQPTLSISYLKFEIYVFIGFIIGTLVSILTFRDRTKSLLN